MAAKKFQPKELCYLTAPLISTKSSRAFFFFYTHKFITYSSIKIRHIKVSGCSIHNKCKYNV